MPSQPDDLIGQVVGGRYRVLRPLGAGGMGTVYLAEHTAIEKQLALKVLRPEYSAKPDLVTRFQREAISASRVKHPNVLDVFDFGQLDNGCFYLAMEFLEGRDLADVLEDAHTLPPGRTLRIMLQICRALAAAHAKGVVHRDLKPENVFLQVMDDGDENVKLVDFGIAQLRSNEEAAASEPNRRRLTRTGMIFGTPEYMSPEQAAGRRMDLRVDVYAAGVILYEMLTGAVPFTGDTFFGVLSAHINDPLPPLESLNPAVRVSAELAAVAAKALEKRAEDRFQSMHELARALLATPEAAGLDAATHKSAVPSVTLAEFDAAAAESARQTSQNEPLPLTTARAARVGDSTAVTARTAVSSTADAARADTVVADEATPPPKPSALPSAWLLTALAFVVALGAAAFKLFPRAEATLPSARSEAPDPSAPVAELTAPPTPVVSPSAAPTGSVGVRLAVKTEPSGAVLLKNGFQVCDHTPCEVLASPNESLELEARKDALRGSAKVLAQRDQTVSIELDTPKLGKPAGSPKPSEKVWCYREVEEDGLKVLKKFRCPGQ